ERITGSRNRAADETAAEDAALDDDRLAESLISPAVVVVRLLEDLVRIRGDAVADQVLAVLPGELPSSGRRHKIPGIRPAGHVLRAQLRPDDRESPRSDQDE